jgi:hypothetical protein
MEPNAEQVRPIGRPPVGPEVKARIPQEVHAYVIRQAAVRRQKRAAIVRSLIMAGYEATRRTGGSR